MNPPSIGEGLSVGWNTFKEHWKVLLIPYLCAMVAGIIPFFAIPGLMLVSLKVLRNETPEPADGFIGFKALVDHLMMGILQIVGLIGCCVGVYVTQALFIPGSLLIIEKGIGWSEAKDQCLEAIKPNLFPWVIYFFVTGIVGGLGSILCGVGIFITLPIATIAWAHAYEQAFAKR
jgi:hypothetical protein